MRGDPLADVPGRADDVRRAVGLSSPPARARRSTASSTTAAASSTSARRSPTNRPPSPRGATRATIWPWSRCRSASSSSPRDAAASAGFAARSAHPAPGSRPSGRRHAPPFERGGRRVLVEDRPHEPDDRGPAIDADHELAAAHLQRRPAPPRRARWPRTPERRRASRRPARRRRPAAPSTAAASSSTPAPRPAGRPRPAVPPAPAPPASPRAPPRSSPADSSAWREGGFTVSTFEQPTAAASANKNQARIDGTTDP